MGSGPSFYGSMSGKKVIEFKDGTVLEFKAFPKLCIENLIYQTKKQIFYDEAHIVDAKTGIEGIIRYNPNFNKGITGIAYRQTLGWIPGLGGLGQNKMAGRPARADDIHIDIIKRDEKNPKKVEL